LRIDGASNTDFTVQRITALWSTIEKVCRLNRGDTLDPETYYFRAMPYFETSSENKAG